MLPLIATLHFCNLLERSSKASARLLPHSLTIEFTFTDRMTQLMQNKGKMTLADGLDHAENGEG